MDIKNLLQSFFEKESRGKQQFPPELENVYHLVMQDRLKKYSTIRNHSFDLNNPSPESVAWQLYKYFPTHYFKSYYSLLKIERLKFEKDHTTQFIGWPGSTLIDIGCGAGSVSISYLVILLRFQQHLLENGKTISPIKVCLVGIDDNDNMLEMYEEMVKRSTALLMPYLIRVKYQTINGKFPTKTDEIFEVVEPAHRHYVLVAQSNIVRPLNDMFDRSETIASEKIARAILDEPEEGQSFGAAESRTIRGFMERWKLDQMGVLSIATSGWHDQLNNLNAKISDKLTSHFHITYHKGKEKLPIVNPKSSYWKSQRSETNINFSWSYLHLAAQSFYQDIQWQNLLRYDNLKLAWARTRQYAMREALTDEIELKLFDIDTDLKLVRLRALMLMQDRDKLNLKWLMPYPAPKDASSTRPKTVARIEEQILSVAIIQLLGHSIDRGNSYSYRLSFRKSEFLYGYWLDAWKTFITDTHTQTTDKIVFRTDIENFYPSVPQKDLVVATQKNLNIEGRTKKLHKFLLSRDCGRTHTKGYGIPQGHIASGFWADIYLGQVDDVITRETFSDVLFARYADDMVFAFDAAVEDIDDDIKEVKDLLHQLDLRLSKEKTLLQDGAQYIESTELDPLLDELSENKFKPLVNQSVFGLPHEYWMHYQNEPENFVNDFYEVLRALSIYMSKSWIHRKLHQHFLTSEKSLNGKKMRWPGLQDFQSNKEKWLSEFRHLNPYWLNSIAVFKDELGTICLESYNNLQKSNIPESQRKKSLRRFRFTANRICTLHASDELYQILTDELIQAPWTISANIVCQGLAHGYQIERLLQILTKSSSTYVRAVAAGIFGSVQYDDTHTKYVNDIKSSLTALLLNGFSDKHERLKSSESLLMFDQHTALTSKQLITMINGETDPYLIKNYILLLGKVEPTSISLFIDKYATKCNELIVHDAIQILRHDLEQVTKKHFEPFQLKGYYHNSYPETEADLETNGDSP